MPTPELKGKATLDDSQMEAAFRRIEKGGIRAVGLIKGAFGSLISPIAAIGPAIAAAFTGKAIISGVAQVFEAGRALRVMSRETGASVAGLVVLQSKFKQAGLDGELVARSIFRLQKSLDGVEDEENKGGSGRLTRLGLNLAALKKLAPDQQLLAVGRAISTIADPAERTSAAMQIFGRTGAELGAVFSKPGFATIAPGLQQKAEMMARNAGIFEEVSIKLEKVGNVLRTVYVGVADRVATSLIPILDQIEKINLVEIGQKFGDGLAKGADALIPAMKAVAAIDWSKVASVLGGGTKFLVDDLSGKHPNPILNAIDHPQEDLVRAPTRHRTDPAIVDGVSSLDHRPETRAVNNRPETLPTGDYFRRVTTNAMMAAGRHRTLSAPSTPYSDDELEQARSQEYERQMAARKAAANGNAADSVSIKYDGIGNSMDIMNARYNAARSSGTALSFDPSSGAGWTGARNGQEGFRRGLSGGTYGRTSNIMTQISGRVAGPKDPAEATAKNTETMAGHMKKVADWVTGGSGGDSGGGSATTTR